MLSIWNLSLQWVLHNILVLSTNMCYIQVVVFWLFVMVSMWCTNFNKWHVHLQVCLALCNQCNVFFFFFITTKRCNLSKGTYRKIPSGNSFRMPLDNLLTIFRILVVLFLKSHIVNSGCWMLIIFLIPEYSQYIMAVFIVDIVKGCFLGFLRVLIIFLHFLQLQVHVAFVFI